ncbi:tetratricopeptide repeat protein [Acanthopleuribacter pedis]|uniref:Tetratricopeptide repeat protein n=1 Tax=Acanthopleuribacter pedis TaxID=442870 RepID=A0A8J7Q631_9BACT|nr:tetratricopeptide repeat protein [Acanthopleuribacter pedis]MBO1318822.1 tetratricopeptide repeat protein [Acanthopleuribacter pedis]
MSELLAELAPYHPINLTFDPPPRQTFVMRPFKGRLGALFGLLDHMRNPHWREAEKFYNDGLRAHSIGMLIEAENAYRQALDLEPEHEPAHINLAAVYIQQGHLEDAELHLRTAIEIRPGFYRGYYNLGLVFAHMEAEDEALLWFQKALERKADHFWSLVNSAEIYVNQNNLEEALTHYQIALATGHDHTAVSLRLADLQQRQGDFKQVEEFLTEALSRRKSPETIYNLAWSQLAQGKFSEAVENLKTALQHQAIFPEAQLNLALALSAKGDNDTSVEQMNKYMEEYLDKKSPTYLPHLRLLTKVNPNNYAALLRLAEIHLNESRINDAVEELEWLLSENPKVPDALKMLGNIFADQGNFKQALRTYRRLVEVAPDQVDGYLGIARSYGAMENYAAATPVIRKVLEMDPNNVELHYLFGTLLAQEGQLREAAKHYKIVAKLRPNYPRIEKRIRMVDDELSDFERMKPKAWPAGRTVRGR